MTMPSKTLSRLLFISACIAASASPAVAQTTTLPEATSSAPVDSVSPNTVTSFSVKSGKLLLASVAHPGPMNLPDGTYTNQRELSIVFQDGRVVRVQNGLGNITDITASRVSRQRSVM